MYLVTNIFNKNRENKRKLEFLLARTFEKNNSWSNKANLTIFICEVSLFISRERDKRITLAGSSD